MGAIEKMANENLNILFQKVGQEYDLGTPKDFEKRMAAPENRLAFFNNIGKAYNLGTFGEFEARIGLRGTPETINEFPSPGGQDKGEGKPFNFIASVLDKLIRQYGPIDERDVLSSGPNPITKRALRGQEELQAQAGQGTMLQELGSSVVADLPMIVAAGGGGAGVAKAAGLKGIKGLLLRETVAGGMFGAATPADSGRQRAIHTLENMALWPAMGLAGKGIGAGVKKLIKKLKSGKGVLKDFERDQIALETRRMRRKISAEFEKLSQAELRGRAKDRTRTYYKGEAKKGRRLTPELRARQDAMTKQLDELEAAGDEYFAIRDKVNKSIVGKKGLEKRLKNEELTGKVRSGIEGLSQAEAIGRTEAAKGRRLTPELRARRDAMAKQLDELEAVGNEYFAGRKAANKSKEAVNKSIVGKKGLEKRLKGGEVADKTKKGIGQLSKKESIYKDLEWLELRKEARAKGIKLTSDKTGAAKQKPQLRHEISKAKPKIDQARAQELKNAIDEGELIIRTGKINGRKMSEPEIDAVKKSVESSKDKLSGGPAQKPKVERAKEKYKAGKPVKPKVRIEETSAGAQITPEGYGPKQTETFFVQALREFGVEPKNYGNLANQSRLPQSVIEDFAKGTKEPTAAQREKLADGLYTLLGIQIDPSKLVKSARKSGKLPSHPGAGGSAYGFELDDEGNLTYDPKKGLQGMAAGYVLGTAGVKIVKDIRSRDVLGIIAGKGIPDATGKKVGGKKLFEKILSERSRIGQAEFNKFAKARGYYKRMTTDEASTLLADIKAGKKYERIALTEEVPEIPASVYETPPRFIFKKPHAGQLWDSFKVTIDKVGGSISTRLENIDPSLKYALRKSEFNVHQATSKDMDVIKSFVKTNHKMNRADRHIFDLARKNGDTVKLTELIGKYNLGKEYESTRRTLDAIYERGQEVGLNFNYMENYHPRKIKNAKGFMQHFESFENWSIFENAIRQKQASIGRVLSNEEKAQLINSMIRGYGDKISLAKTGNMKARTVEYIDGDLNKFYHDSDTALLKYIQEVNEIIEARRFFGKGKENSVLFDEMTAKVEIEQSIGEYIAKLVDGFKIKPSQEAEIRDILHARFNARGTHGIIGVYKNLEYIDTMGQFTSALTQIGDFAFPIYKAGLPRTVVAGAKAAINKSELTTKQFGINNIAHELLSDNKTGKMVSKVFKLIGLEKIDRLGKETLVNGVLSKYRKMAIKNPGKLKGIINKVFEKDTDAVIKDLADGEVTQNVKLLMFNELLDMQPIALSEMPQQYLKSGNGRIFYMLKTWTLKQLDVYRREVFNAPSKLEGLKNFIYLTGALVISEMTADTAKDFVLGRKTNLDDRVMDGLLRRVGFSKWALWKAREEGMLTAIKYYTLPPSKIFDNAYKEYIALKNDKWKGSETVQSVPLVGKPYYWWFGRGKEKKERYARKGKSKKTLKLKSTRSSGRGTRSRSGRGTRSR